MITLTLPSQDRRVFVRSFWCTVTTLFTLSCLTLAWWWQVSGLIAVGLGVSVAFAMVAVMREDVMWRVYRAWNSRLAVPIARVIARMVMRICFIAAFVAVGRAGSRFDQPPAARSSSSLWTSRRTLAREEYYAPFAAASRGGASSGWISDYVAWAGHTQNRWALSLLPFLMVLRLVRTQDDHASQANIYTLF